MPIDRCVCTDFTFEEILAIAEETDLPIHRVMARTGASGSCGCCLPYVEHTIKTKITLYTKPLPTDPTKGLRWKKAKQFKEMTATAG